MSANISAYELHFRGKKLDAMVAFAERSEKIVRCAPTDTLRFWRDATNAEWAQLAINCAIKPPSETTRKAFISALARRLESE